MFRTIKHGVGCARPWGGKSAKQTGLVISFYDIEHYYLHKKTKYKSIDSEGDGVWRVSYIYALPVIHSDTCIQIKSEVFLHYHLKTDMGIL